MSAILFSVTEHIIPCQHIREYPHAVKSEQVILNLAIKEYKPLNNLDASPGSITFIAAHANGLPKETYEPLWDELHGADGHNIRAIWIADSSHQGASGVLNEKIQGDDPSWFDHSRDLLSMVNHFRERMPRPIFGIAHSMGAPQLLNLSFMHPRLFHGLALIEPIIQRDPPPGPNVALSTSYRSDLWPSRGEAEASFQKSSFFRAWDSRVLEKYCQYGLRDTPTALYPTETKSGTVTLTTSKHQEAWSYARSNFTPLSMDPQDHRERLMSPDLDPSNERTYQFHRAEMVQTLQNLPQIRPSILWIFGSRSHINPVNLQDEKMALTGTGIGGNGGVKAGKVEKAIIENAGHMVPLEKVNECATVLGSWLEKKIEEFGAEETFLREHKSGKSEREMLVTSKQWLKGVRQKSDIKRPIKEHL